MSEIIHKKIKKQPTIVKRHLIPLNDSEDSTEETFDFKLSKSPGSITINKDIKNAFNIKTAIEKKPGNSDKDKSVIVPFFFYDGFQKAHLLSITKRTTVGEFLESARKLICHDYPNLTAVRGNLVLMLVVGDWILSTDNSLWEIEQKSERLKLDGFLVVEIGSEGTCDSWKNKNIKVVERQVFESGKHLFPFSQWKHLNVLN